LVDEDAEAENPVHAIASRGPAGRADALPTAATHFVNGAPLERPYPQGSENAIFGLGCYSAQSPPRFYQRRPFTLPKTITSNISPRTRTAIVDWAVLPDRHWGQRRGL